MNKNLLTLMVICLVSLSGCNGNGNQSTTNDAPQDSTTNNESMNKESQKGDQPINKINGSKNNNVSDQPTVNPKESKTEITNNSPTGSNIHMALSEADETINTLIRNKALELNKCLKNTDTTPCNKLIAEDIGSISGTSQVRASLYQFPPYINAIKDLSWNPTKIQQTDKGEKIYVITGMATTDDNGKKVQMYIKYNFVDQENTIKCYGIQFFPNKLDDEF